MPAPRTSMDQKSIDSASRALNLCACEVLMINSHEQAQAYLFPSRLSVRERRACNEPEEAVAERTITVHRACPLDPKSGAHFSGTNFIWLSPVHRHGP